MVTSELPLVIYTILMQLAVGSFIVIELVRYLSSSNTGTQDTSRLTNRALFVLGPVSILGILASFAHLKIPLHAPYALTNVGTSWMSREIWLSIIFTAFIVVYSVMQGRNLGSQTIRVIVAVVTGIAGIALIYSMASVYMIESYPAWNTLATPFSFYVTTFLLGSVFAGAAFTANYFYVRRTDPKCEEVQCMLLKKSLKWITVVAAILLGLEMVTTSLYLSYLALAETPASVQSAGMLFGEFGVLFAFRLALVFVGAGILGMLVYRNAVHSDQGLRLIQLTYGIFALVLVSEVVGRILFYAASVKIGI